MMQVVLNIDFLLCEIPPPLDSLDLRIDKVIDRSEVVFSDSVPVALGIVPSQQSRQPQSGTNISTADVPAMFTRNAF